MLQMICLTKNKYHSELYFIFFFFLEKKSPSVLFVCYFFLLPNEINCHNFSLIFIVWKLIEENVFKKKLQFINSYTVVQFCLFCFFNCDIVVFDCLGFAENKTFVADTLGKVFVFFFDFYNFSSTHNFLSLEMFIKVSVHEICTADKITRQPIVSLNQTKSKSVRIYFYLIFICNNKNKIPKNSPEIQIQIARIWSSLCVFPIRNSLIRKITTEMESNSSTVRSVRRVRSYWQSYIESAVLTKKREQE